MESLEIHLVRSSNDHTLTLSTPVARNGGGGGGDSGDYEDLINKPSINGVELLGDVSFKELGLGDIPLAPLTNAEIDAICRY